VTQRKIINAIFIIKKTFTKIRMLAEQKIDSRKNGYRIFKT